MNPFREPAEQEDDEDLPELISCSPTVHAIATQIAEAAKLTKDLESLYDMECTRELWQAAKYAHLATQELTRAAMRISTGEDER